MTNYFTFLLTTALGLVLGVGWVTNAFGQQHSDPFPADYRYSGWRGGIGIAFGEPARKIRDVTELGLDIVWGDEDPLRAAMLDVAVFRYWNCTVELSLKDSGGRFDFSHLEDKDEAARLAFDKSAEFRYGVAGLSKYASVKYSPESPYGDVFGTMDISSHNPLVEAVTTSYVRALADSGVNHGGVALDNAGKVPKAFLRSFRDVLRPEGLGIATNGCSRYGDNVGEGIYLFVNSNRPEVIQCNAGRLGFEDSTIAFDEFSETVLDARREGGFVRFQTPSGPSLIQLARAETIVGNTLARAGEMFDAQQLQHRMDARFRLGYPRNSLKTPDGGGQPGAEDESDFGEPLRPWQPFCQGYVIDRKTKRSGVGSLRADGRAYTVYSHQWAYHNRQGAAQFVTVNQEKPKPLTLRGFSKAESVQKSELKAITDANRRDHFGERLGHFYAMHLYLDYQDGAWPETHTFGFSPGTHEWEEGRITVTPKKAVKTAMVLVELHQPSGTAWFDDFSLAEATDPERNLLACSDFGDNDTKRAEAKAEAYGQKVARLLEAVKETRMQISKDSLKKLADELQTLKAWLTEQGIAQMYGREMRDLADVRRKISVRQQVLD